MGDEKNGKVTSSVEADQSCGRCALEKDNNVLCNPVKMLPQLGVPETLPKVGDYSNPLKNKIVSLDVLMLPEQIINYKNKDHVFNFLKSFFVLMYLNYEIIVLILLAKK